MGISMRHEKAGQSTSFWQSAKACAIVKVSWHKISIMAKNSSSNEVRVGAQGRLVIPASLRKSLNVKAGDRLIARRVGESLVLERRGAIEKRLQDRFRHIPKEVSMVDELVAERRKEAALEASEE